MLSRLCGVLTVLLSMLLTATMPKIFFWGCLAEGCANQPLHWFAPICLQARKSYLTNAYRNMDYIFRKECHGILLCHRFRDEESSVSAPRLSDRMIIEAPLPGFPGWRSQSWAAGMALLMLPTCRMSLMQMWRVRMLPMR